MRADSHGAIVQRPSGVRGPYLPLNFFIDVVPSPIDSNSATSRSSLLRNLLAVKYVIKISLRSTAASELPSRAERTTKILLPPRSSQHPGRHSHASLGGIVVSPGSRVAGSYHPAALSSTSIVNICSNSRLDRVRRSCVLPDYQRCLSGSHTMTDKSRGVLTEWQVEPVSNVAIAPPAADVRGNRAVAVPQPDKRREGLVYLV
jgi:hypothetical protein